MTLLKKHQEIEDEKFDEEFALVSNEYEADFKKTMGRHMTTPVDLQSIKSHIHAREARLLERVREEIRERIKMWENGMFPDKIDELKWILTLITPEK